MENTDRDDNFWLKYHQLRRRKMPSETDLYSTLEQVYRNKRKHFENQWSDHFDKALPNRSIQFYNKAFETAQTEVNRLFDRNRISIRTRQLADRAYGVRLRKGDRLRDLMRLDVFGDKTINQDIHPSLVFGDIAAAVKRDPIFLSDTHHFFFHRGQRTEHIFLHEIIVGFLLNEVENKHVHSRHTLPLTSYDYPSSAAYTLTRLAKLMKLNSAQVVALHFEDSETLNKVLPEFVKDLMLAASHVYWHLDVFSKWSNKHSPADLLRFVYNFFIVNSLEREMAEGGLKMRRSAGKYIDRTFFSTIFKSYPKYGEGVSDPEIVRALCLLVENLWVR